MTQQNTESKRKDEDFRNIKTIKSMEEETDNFVADHLRMFRQMWEKDRLILELSSNVEKLRCRSKAFGNSSALTKSKLKRRLLIIKIFLILLLAFIVLFFIRIKF